MSATTLPQGRSLSRIYWLEAKAELLKVWRVPAYTLPTLLFPLIFYLFFGVVMAKKGPDGLKVATYLLATYGTFGVLGASLFGFGVGVAMERGQGWMLFKRATPMPPLAHLFGKLTMCVLFGALVVSGLFTLGITVGGVEAPAGTLFLLGLVTVAGALPFGALGLAIGYWAGPNSAPALVNLLYLPMSICSGLWFPIQMLPTVMQKIAPIFPAFHLAQLGLRILGLGKPLVAPMTSVTVLVGFTVAALALAWIGYRRDEGKTFG